MEQPREKIRETADENQNGAGPGKVPQRFRTFRLEIAIREDGVRRHGRSMPIWFPLARLRWFRPAMRRMHIVPNIGIPGPRLSSSVRRTPENKAARSPPPQHGPMDPLPLRRRQLQPLARIPPGRWTIPMKG